MKEKTIRKIVIEHPIRRMILTKIDLGFDNINDLCEILKIEKTVIVNHLTIMKRSGLISLDNGKIVSI